MKLWSTLLKEMLYNMARGRIENLQPPAPEVLDCNGALHDVASLMLFLIKKFVGHLGGNNQMGQCNCGWN